MKKNLLKTIIFIISIFLVLKFSNNILMTLLGIFGMSLQLSQSKKTKY